MLGEGRRVIYPDPDKARREARSRPFPDRRALQDGRPGRAAPGAVAVQHPRPARRPRRRQAPPTGPRGASAVRDPTRTAAGSNLLVEGFLQTELN